MCSPEWAQQCVPCTFSAGNPLRVYFFILALIENIFINGLLDKRFLYMDLSTGTNVIHHDAPNA
jgi:hypothetical protein